jgi:hypothetical protein
MLLNVFMAGPDRVRWELKALGAHGNGPYSLVIRHSAGVIVEYFDDVTKALMREGELEALLVAARGSSPADFGWGELSNVMESGAAH